MVMGESTDWLSEDFFDSIGGEVAGPPFRKVDRLRGLVSVSK